MINIDQAFNTENSSVFRFYQRPGVGFYIPLYQREYSWDSDNIEQLLEDITKGVENITEDGEGEIRFLGTIITVAETDKNKIQPQDTKALPVLIEKIIDGQQRLASIALISALLFQHIRLQENKIEKSITKLIIEEAERDNLKQEINETCQFWKDKLLDTFSVDLKRGRPSRKPKIIRGSVDKWVMQEEINNSYHSTVAHYLFQFIGHFVENGSFPNFNKNDNAGKNLTIINQWLEKTVVSAHVNNNGFITASKILELINQEDIWQYDRVQLKNLVNDKNAADPKSISYHLNSLVQIFAVCHYLLDRCCFTIIQPINDDWAFDMFQSLNATGTPLTAIETFKPLVVNTVNNRGDDFKNSIENTYFRKIEGAFGDLRSAAQKSKLTNELLTSFALPLNGTKLATHFSTQRKWLERVYQKRLYKSEEKREFVKFFGNYSEFYNAVWNNYRGENSQILSLLAGSNDAELASKLLIFLIDSNHKMAITLLGSFYHNVLEGKQSSIPNFISLVKLISAFYIIWRSVKSNSGLDDVYRTFFRGSVKQNIPSNEWIDKKDFNIEDVRNYFVGVLKAEVLDNKEGWLKGAAGYLRYDNSHSICRLALFLAAHDTIPDPLHPGLVKNGTNNCSPYFTLEKWTSSDLKTIEHIAPETRSPTWDDSLYDEAQLFQSIGNLTLLPSNVNISASNKGWKEKYLYYQHLGIEDPDTIQELANKANANGLTLSPSTIELLKKSHYAQHVKPILAYGENSTWNGEIVKKRANGILSILWNQVSPWIIKK